MPDIVFNALLFFLSIALFLTLLILVYKLLGKSGIYAYIAFATILANIAACKSIELFSLTTTAGSVLYASTFLCTDILSEKYGKKEAQRGVILGIITNVLWIIGTQVILMFIPSSSDTFQGSLNVVFGMVPRVTIASLAGFIVSQTVDVVIYHAIWRKTGNNKTKLWLRNNVATLIAQAFDTGIFVTISFIFVYDWPVFFSILGTTYLFKAIVALCDTPFCYWARSLNTISKEDQKLERKEN